MIRLIAGKIKAVKVEILIGSFMMETNQKSDLNDKSLKDLDFTFQDHRVLVKLNHFLDLLNQFI